jgi:hypothetical protein
LGEAEFLRATNRRQDQHEEHYAHDSIWKVLLIIEESIQHSAVSTQPSQHPEGARDGFSLHPEGAPEGGERGISHLNAAKGRMPSLISQATFLCALSCSFGALCKGLGLVLVLLLLFLCVPSCTLWLKGLGVAVGFVFALQLPTYQFTQFLKNG